MFARFTFRKINSAASRLNSWVSNNDTLDKSGAKGNKQSTFKTRRLGKIVLPKLPRGKRVLLALLLLASSAAALTSLGIRQAMRPGPSLAHAPASGNPANVAPATGDAPLTKLREYVYAGGRLITSEEKSCVPTFSRPGADFPQGGGTGFFNVSISECDWNATSNAEWITINDPSSGAGSGVVNYSVAANSGPQRVGTITVNGQPFTITQAPNQSTCAYWLDDSDESLSDQAGSRSVNLMTGGGCSWTAVSNATSWLTVTSPADGNGVGPGAIGYLVTANSGQQRVGSISIKAGGQTVATFTVTQAPNQASCTFALNPDNWTYGPESASGWFNVTTQAGCRWAAAANVGWLIVTGGAISPEGGGNGTVSFDVQSNTGGQRTGLISVGNRNFTVTQHPNQASCAVALSPNSWTYGVGGGNGSFNVATQAGCQWDAVPTVGWITVASPGSGVGNGSVGFTVQANNGDSRGGTISVRGQAFTVMQCGFVVSPASDSFTWSGGQGSVTVNSGNHTCSWSAVSNAPWITITSGASGTQHGTVNYSVAQFGELDGVRTGTLTISGQTVTITQTGTFDPCIKKPWLCEGPLSTEIDQSASGAEQRGLTAHYFGNTTLSGQPELERTDAVINFDWAGARTDAAPPAAGFSARWRGQLNAPSSEAYTFYLHSNDGARLWVNNRLVIDRWEPSSEPYTRSAPVELKSGEKADIRLEYYNAGGEALIQLLWSSASTPRQIIPRKYLYPEAARNKSTPADADKQTGMLLPPRFGASPNAMIAGLATPLVRTLLVLSIAACLLALSLWNVMLTATRRRAGRGDSAGEKERVWTLSPRLLGALSATVVKQAQRGAGRVARLIALLVAPSLRLLLENLRTVAGKALSLWRGSGAARLNPVFRRALIIALIVRLAVPLTTAEAEGLVLAAQTVWREVSAYTSSAMKPSATATSGARPVKVVSRASQTLQVDALQVCPSQLIMFVGERYTLTPVALGVTQSDGGRLVIHGARMNWSSLNGAVAKVSSFGQVEAIGVGTTIVEIQSGGASKQIPIEVRAGMRPTGSNQEADLDTGNCSEEQASMYAPYSPQAKAAAAAQQNLLGDDGVILDWDPAPLLNSRAAHFRNAVGNPRFAASSRGGAVIPTSVQLGSYSYQFNAPVVSVGGRGAGASIGMTLNSRVWNVDEGKLTFNYVGAYPAPGWAMGYGKIIRNYNATATGDHSGVGTGNSPGDYLLVTGDGTRIRLVARYVATQSRWLHESDDGSFLQFDPKSGEMRYPDGNRMIYSSVNGCLLPTAVINSNGGAITMTYRDYCEGASCQRVFRHRTALSAVRDTLGRYITFHYYGDNDYPAAAADGRPGGELAAIKAPDMSGVQQEIIHLEYQYITLKYDFGGMVVDAPANNSQIQVMRRVYYPQTGRGFLFLDYSSYGMPRKISSRMGMRGAGGKITDGMEIAYTTYNYTTIDPSDPYGRNQVGILDDFPQFTRREEWWQGKTDANGAPTTATTKYDYFRTTNAATEVSTIKHVDKNFEVVTTTGADNSQLSFGKAVSVELKKSNPSSVLSRQVFTYMTGPSGEVEIEKVETFDDAGQGRLESFSYGPYGRVTNKYEYGYKQGSDYQVRRRTQYDYIDDQNYIDDQGLREARFLRLVSRVSVFDASGATKAKTEVEYDNYAAMGGLESYGLNAGAYPPNHDATYNQSYVLRGNPTAVTTFSRVNPDESTTRRVRYDIFGNVVKAQLSCCVEKFFSFSNATYYSQPDWVRSGPEAGLSLQTTYQYNDFTGLVESETDPDGHDTIYSYDDALRLEQVTLPTGAVAITHFERDGAGNDLLTYISQTSYDDQGTQKVITSKQWFDGAGRVIRAGTGTGDSPGIYDMVATVYDGWGRVTKRSNPYLGDADGNPQGGNQFWTVNSYDELSRVVDVTMPGAPPTQTIHTNYDGAVTTVTDTVGRQRRSEVDGLGRLVKVIEQNPANGNLEWVTTYSYDTLNNLIQSNQGGQIRTFVYDAKSRLTSETTPEAGTISYTYTPFDAVQTRTDARGVVTTYTYGELNLPTGMSYSSVTGVAETAPVSVTYKRSSPGKAQVETVTDGSGSESYGYDGFGQLASRTRVIDGISYGTQYQYNAAGQMTLMIYPSGKRVKVGHDARGRLSALQRVGDGGGVQESYLSGINYRVEGLISSQTLGNGAIENFEYSDDRLQLTSQTVTKGGNTLLDLDYVYDATAGQMGSGSTAGNSGQVVSVSGTINGQNRNQSFTYDNVGRLVTATGWGSWARRYDYDRYGNQTAVWDAVSGGGQLQNTMIAKVSGVETNRIASVNGTAFIYDASGNVTGDGARALTYDAENRVVSVSVNGLGSESYGYDAGNRRVRKVVGGVVTHYIWEGNQVIAEYERGGGSTPATGTRYYHQDRLSTRAITDGAGAVVGTTDQLPFGEEFGSSGAGEKHKFTTYERDGIGLDYAVNRHYDPRQGRFNQVDPLGMGAASLTDPQSLNMYGYVRNDPINSVDPSGLLPSFCGAEYGFGACGGSGGFWGGNFGGDVARYNRDYGGLSRNVADALQKHDRRVANDQAGWGYAISEDFEGGGFEPNPTEYPAVDTNDVKNALKMATKMLQRKECDEALKDYGIPSLSALLNGLKFSGPDANVFDGRTSSLSLPIGQNGSQQTVADYFKENKTKVGAVVFHNLLKGDGDITFLGYSFYNPEYPTWITHQQAIILFHEAVHQVAKKGDAVFKGSKALSEKIIQGCWPILKGKLGGVG